MAHPKTIEEIREELAGVILEAVPEEDPVRRKALLTLADHWSDILRRRRENATSTLPGREDQTRLPG